MLRKTNSRYFALAVGVVAAMLLQGCGLFGSRGAASEKLNRRGEVTGVPKRSGWQQALPHQMVPVSWDFLDGPSGRGYLAKHVFNE